MPPFPQGDEGSCVPVVRDSVREYVGWCPQRCCSKGKRGLGLGLFCEHVLLERENLCFPVEVGDRVWLCETGCDLKRNILCDW